MEVNPGNPLLISGACEQSSPFSFTTGLGGECSHQIIVKLLVLCLLVGGGGMVYLVDIGEWAVMLKLYYK